MNNILSRFYRKKELFYPFLSALLLGVSRLPLHLNFVVFIAFVPLLIFLQRFDDRKKVFRAGLIFGFTYTLVCLHWIGLVTVPGLAGIFIIISLYFAILLLLISKLKTLLPKLHFIIFIFFWLAFEIIQNYLGEFRFAWFNLGYALADYTVLIQIGEIGGIYIVSLMILIINILLYRIIQTGRYRWRSFLLPMLIVLVWLGFGIYRYKTIKLVETGKNIGIVQVSIPQHLKWEEEYVQTTLDLYEEYTKALAAEQPDLIIWPESALPAYVMREPRFRYFVADLAQELKTDIFLGFPHYEFAIDYPQRYKFYNACTRVNKQGIFDDLYCKIILVPFGERMPLLSVFPALWDLQFGQANFEYGIKQVHYDLDGYRYSPLICFEIVFPRLTTQMAQDEVDFIVNITNDAWFKRSAGTYQHMVMAKFRAVETRMPVYRAANTGYSVIISARGDIQKQTELYEKTTITHPLEIYDGRSIYTQYLNWLPYIFLVGSLIFIILGLIILIRDRINEQQRGEKQ
jgi:apolipoprotein N-acyltransferase